MCRYYIPVYTGKKYVLMRFLRSNLQKTQKFLLKNELFLIVNKYCDPT